MAAWQQIGSSQYKPLKYNESNLPDTEGVRGSKPLSRTTFLSQIWKPSKK